MLQSFIIPAIIAVRKNEEAKRPCKVSYAISGLLVLNWLLFLTGSYTLLPARITDVIFIPVWLILCVAGIFSVIYEFKNNKGFAIPIAGLTTISLLFTVLASGISEM